MIDTLRVCLYGKSDAPQDDLVTALGGIAELRLVQCFDQWEELRACVSARSVDLVLVNLDPDMEFALQIVQHVVRLAPQMGVIGVGSAREPTAIIAAMRAGCSQFVCAPVDRADLESAIARVRSTRAAGTLKSQRICVVGASGGVGATMVACNLALELAQVTERQSALVDLNLEYGDIAAAFDCRPKYSISDVCRAGSDVDLTMIETAIVPLPCKVAILARPEALADAHSVSPEAVAQCLKVLSTLYAHVVVDLPRSFSELSAAALSGTNLTLIVMQLTVPSIRNAGRILDALTQMGVEEGQGKVEIVINRWRAEHDRISSDDVEKQFKRPIYALIPNDYRRVSSALDFGHPMLADAPGSPARLAIQEMAKVIGAEAKEPAVDAPRRGLFSKLLGKKAVAQ